MENAIFDVVCGGFMGRLWWFAVVCGGLRCQFAVNRRSRILKVKSTRNRSDDLFIVLQ